MPELVFPPFFVIKKERDAMKANFEHAVRVKIERRPYLIPMFTHPLDIPKRLNDYDDSFFVVYNKNSNKYEVHSLDYPEGDTVTLTVQHSELDERTMQDIWMNDIRVHGREIFRRLERSEERARIRAEKEQKELAREFAKEFQGEFAKDAWKL